MLYPSSQVKELPSTVTPRLAETRPQGTTCLSKSTGAGPDSPWASHNITHASARHSKRAPTHPRVRMHYGSVPSRRGTSGAGHTPQATPSHQGTRPPLQVEESTSCVCISMSLSNPNHTTQVCLKNTHVFQTTKTRKLTIITTGSSELIGRR